MHKQWHLIVSMGLSESMYTTCRPLLEKISTVEVAWTKHKLPIFLVANKPTIMLQVACKAEWY
jgi:hypothetical protein